MTTATYNSNERPQNSEVRVYVNPSESKIRKGFTNDNSQTYYDIDLYYRVIVLKFKSKYDIEEEVVRYNLYANHFGGVFTVSQEQDKAFEKAYKRVLRLSK